MVILFKADVVFCSAKYAVAVVEDVPVTVNAVALVTAVVFAADNDSVISLLVTSSTDSTIDHQFRNLIHVVMLERDAVYGIALDSAKFRPSDVAFDIVCF